LGELDNISIEEKDALYGRNGQDFNSGKKIFNPTKLTDQSGRIGSSIIHPFRPEGPQCVVTKISTSVQSSNTSYLTKEGIDYIKEKHHDIFHRLVELYVPKFLNESDSIKTAELEKKIYKTYLRKLQKSKKDDGDLLIFPTLQ
jgi:hypothetical protein